MRDQATELRQLVSRAIRDAAAAHGPPPRLIVVSSAPTGAGATTLAIHLSAALVECGARAVLVDADPRRPDATVRCGLDGPFGAGVESPVANDLHERLRRGPDGLLVLPGVPTFRSDGSTQRGQLRLVRQLRSLGRHADLIVVDAGSAGAAEPTPDGGPLWQAADDWLLVTCAENFAIMEAYAALKRLSSGSSGTARLHAVVNRADDEPAALEAARRFAQACSRFLGRSVETETAVVRFDADERSNSNGRLLRNAGAPAASTLRRLAERLMERPSGGACRAPPETPEFGRTSDEREPRASVAGKTERTRLFDGSSEF